MPIYYGWWIVAISVVLLMLSLGTTVTAFGLYVLPVSQELGLSRADVNTGVILINLGMGISAPIIGRMIDVYSAKRIMLVSAVLFGGSLVALGLSRSILLSAVVLMLPLAFGIGGIGLLSTSVLVARWFEAQRGRAMAIVVMGISLGTVIMSPTVGALIAWIGWRQCLILLGGTTTVVFVLLVLLVRERPGPNDVEPVSGGAPPAGTAAGPAPAPGKPPTTMQLIRRPQFWTLALGMALAMGSLQSIIISLVPLAQDFDIPVARAASLLSAVGLMAIAGKLVLAWRGDRLDRNLALVVMFVVVAVTCAVLLISKSFLALLACSAMLGFASGATTPVFLALLADRVGAASFGTANGFATLLMAVFGAAAVRLSGEIYDRTGSYDAMFATIVGAVSLAAVLTFASGLAAKRG